MLKGDLSSTPLAPLLLELSDSEATGCLVITDPAAEEALVYLKGGLIYSVSVPGTRPQLGAKLVSSGALAPEALSEALEAQRTELQGWRLGELLVHLGYVDQPLVEAFVKEQVNEALWDLLRWNDGQWKFRKNVKAREDVGPPMPVVELLELLRDRGYEWEAISAIVHGPDAIPRLSTRGDGSQETTLDNDAWSMLCKIDGERSVEDLARDCGYTLFEAGLVMVSLVESGLVDIDEDLDLAAGELYGATTLTSALAGDLDDAETDEPVEPNPEDSLSRVARLVSEVARDHAEDDLTEDVPATDDPRAPLTLVPGHAELANPMIVHLHRHSNESFAASIARVSSALSEVLGDSPPPAAEELDRPVRRRTSPSTSDPEWQRRKRLRAAAAAELATAQALVETFRPGANSTSQPDFTGEVPKVVSRETEQRRAAERAGGTAGRNATAAALRAARELTAQETANRQAETAEAERVAAEQAAADEAARDAAEQAAAEQVAAEEAARVAAEQAATEEAERVAAEQAADEEAARVAAENAAAEEAARIAAEQAATEEAARVAAEQAAAEEAARVAAEQAAAEEAARVAAEQAATEEAARVAAEQAATEEAARVAAEQAAAEEAARLAAAQAAEQAAEAERMAAAVEAARLADEADRLAAAQATLLAEQQAAEAQAEAQRQAAAANAAASEAAADREAQAEAERVAIEDDEQAAAAQAKAERAARRKAEKLEAEQAAQQEDQAAAATALLIELAATAETAPEPTQTPVDADMNEQVPEPVSVGNGYNDAGMADTAALLRELSSLGGDADDRAAAAGPTTTRAPTTTSNDKKAKKKIGLFGL